LNGTERLLNTNRAVSQMMNMIATAPPIRINSDTSIPATWSYDETRIPASSWAADGDLRWGSAIVVMVVPVEWTGFP
jgi:hypothetical protein